MADMIVIIMTVIVGLLGAAFATWSLLTSGRRNRHDG
jgi:hypothetical protein